MERLQAKTALIDGVLLVDKPSGPSSHDIVDIVRRSFGIRRVGHAGTLDPFATGLLILLLGRATRILPYLDTEPKLYAATIAFGRETDTDDPTGATRRTAEPPSLEAIQAAIPALTGPILQTPPDYSAKQVAGKRAYRAARSGAPLPLQPVPVNIHGWEVRGYDNAVLDVSIACEGGTYIRSLGRDLGRLCQSAAHVTALRRTAAGRFSIESAHVLDRIREGDAGVLSALDALPEMQHIQLSAAEEAAVLHGARIPATSVADVAALVGAAGNLVAIAAWDVDAWQPRVVFDAP